MKDYRFIQIILILVIIVNIVICVLTVLYTNKMDQETSKEEPPEYEYVLTENTTSLSNQYKGNMTADEIMKSVSDFMIKTVNDILNNCNGKTDLQILEYYRNNKDSLVLSTRINDENIFLQLVKQIQIVANGANSLEYESSSYNIDSFYDENGAGHVVLEVQYKDKEKTQFQLVLSNTSNIIEFLPASQITAKEADTNG